MKPSPTFTLQFQQQTDVETREEILALACKYPVEDDAEELCAGKRLRAGIDIRDNLLIVYNWKLQAFKRFNLARHLADNCDDELRDVIGLAVNAKTARAAIAVLVGLAGVGIPVASAILTMMFPARFTVIDKRALKSLGILKNDGTVWFYLEYLKECLKLAKRYDVELRTLDRALWQANGNGGRAPSG